jgi:hypothetical protein
MADEKTYTRYLILTTDEAAITFTRVGEQLANGADEAIRKHLSDPPADGEALIVAVSENSFKLRPAKAKVTTSLGEPVALGKVGPEPASPSEAVAAAPAQEELVA